jgi:indolepyruvate ferredoxin oxidoreductase beta subunit
MILSMEPLESLRYLSFLRPDGALITSTTPVINIPDYPDLNELLGKIRAVPGALLVDSDRLAKAAGSARAANMVMVGAASHLLPVKVETMEHYIESVFKKKGDQIVEANLKAFRAGREVATKERHG